MLPASTSTVHTISILSCSACRQYSICSRIFQFQDVYGDYEVGRPKPPKNFHQRDPYEQNYVPIPEYFQPKPPQNLHQIDHFETGFKPPAQYSSPRPPRNIHQSDAFEHAGGYRPPIKPHFNHHHQQDYHKPTQNINFQPHFEPEYHEPVHQEPVHHEPIHHEVKPKPKPYPVDHPLQEDILEERHGCSRPDGSFVQGGATWALPDCRMGICAKSIRGGWEIATER